MIKVLATASLVAAAIVGTAGPAAAASHSWAVGNDSYHIYFTDLDLTTPVGRAAMLQRVEAAATKLCDARTNLPVDLKACVTEVVDASTRSSPILARAAVERSDVALAAR